MLTVGRKSDASCHGWFLEPTPSAPLLWEHCRWRFTQMTGGVSLPASSPSSVSFNHLISPHRPRANRTPESPKWQHSKKVLYGNPPRKSLVATYQESPLYGKPRRKLCPNSQLTPRPPWQMIESCPLRLVLGADTLSPTEVGALSVAVHPDDGCLSSTCLQVTFRSACFQQHSVWHFLALKNEL